jgi:hypothetical protein
MTARVTRPSESISIAREIAQSDWLANTHLSRPKEVVMSGINNERANETEKESMGAYIGNVVLAMLFPILMLWYGPKYLLKKEYAKGIAIILIVVIELAILWSIYNAS